VAQLLLHKQKTSVERSDIETICKPQLRKLVAVVSPEVHSKLINMLITDKDCVGYFCFFI